MHDLQPLTPLGTIAPRRDEIGPVSVIEICGSALASVSARLGNEAATQGVLSEVIGASAPAPSRHDGGEVSAFWTGPDQWMVEAPHDTHEDLASHLAERFKDNASVTEQTDAWCRFDLQGDQLSSVLERLCSADTGNWSGGEVQRSAIDHLGCFVLCRSPSHMSIIGPRSSASSLHHALVVACKSVF